MLSTFSKNTSGLASLSPDQSDYARIWALQKELVSQRARDAIADTIVYVEHPHVFTMGRKSPEYKTFEENLVQEWQGVPLFLVERGGEITYHGPGQLVIYPIVKVSAKMGARGFLRLLESVIISVLQDYSLEGFVKENATGVWIRDQNNNDKKIASLGISLKDSVSYHGLALNVFTDLEYFKKIRPCGFAPDIMTSLFALTGERHPLDALKDKFKQEFLKRQREWQ